MSGSATIEEPEILRADGLKPSKHGYLPHSEIWFAYNDPNCGRAFSSRWAICYVELADGRFCLEGCLWCIRRDDYEGVLGRKDRPHRRNNFPTRAACLRAAAAREILVMRGARQWTAGDDLRCWYDYARAVNWALDLVARETGGARAKRRLPVGSRGLVEQLAALGWSRKQIRKYVATLPAHGPR
jgi:hypothetical protein